MKTGHKSTAQNHMNKIPWTLSLMHTDICFDSYNQFYRTNKKTEI